MARETRPTGPGSTSLDIAGNRRSANYTRRERLSRLAWGIGALVFRAIPRPLFATRAAWLRLFGAKIGRHTQIYPSVRIFMPSQLEIGDWSSVGDRAILYNLAGIRIGARATISQGAHLCAGTHDFRDPRMTLVRGTISVGDEAWLCADCFIGPEVTIGTGAVIAARAVAMRDVPPGIIIAGNPAREIGRR